MDRKWFDLRTATGGVGFLGIMAAAAYAEWHGLFWLAGCL